MTKCLFHLSDHSVFQLLPLRASVTLLSYPLPRDSQESVRHVSNAQAELVLEDQGVAILGRLYYCVCARARVLQHLPHLAH